MSKPKFKDYHRPFMVVETFVPNEFVAACVKNYHLWVSGLYGRDFNDNKKYDDAEGDNLGGDYYTLRLNVAAGHYEILNEGLYKIDGHQTYLFVGDPSSWTWNPGQYTGNPEDLNYKGDNWVPLLYAQVKIFLESGPPETDTIYFMEDGTHGVTNAS